MRSIAELDRIRNMNYEEGKAVLAADPAVVSLFERLQTDCPHVDRRAIVSLFHLRNEEIIQATAHRLEYNATHGGAPVLPP